MLISVDVEKEEKNIIYSKSLGLEDSPFFIVGDSVRGRVFVSSSGFSTTPPPNSASFSSLNEKVHESQKISHFDLSESTETSINDKFHSQPPKFSFDTNDIATSDDISFGSIDSSNIANSVISSTAPERKPIIPTNSPALKSNSYQVKMKAIKVQLVAMTYLKTSLINISVLQSISLIENEKISFPFESNFTFPDVKPPYTSFIGQNSRIEFRVEVICEKSIRTYQNSTVIYFIKPQSIQQTLREQKITVQNKNPNFSVSVLIPSSFISTTELVKGKISVGELDPNSIKKASIIITSEEAIKHLQYPKQFETDLIRYQVIDGTPISNREAPFILQMSTLKLWPLQPSKDCLIRFKLSLTLFVETTEGSSYSVTQTLGLYQKSLN